MNNSYRILFMGTPDFAVPSLKALCENGYKPAAIYTQPDKINGRGKKIVFSPVKEFALENNIPCCQPDSLKTEDEIEQIRQLNPDLIIVIAYGKILPKAILEVPKFGAINVHASLLPKYRGAAPIQRAIIDGEKTTGVTIMKLNEGMDTGDIISQKSVDIPAHMTGEELFEQLSNTGAQELIQVMNDLPHRLDQAFPQNHEAATYAEKITKTMGNIDWSKSVRELDCLIRGMYPNPGTYTFFRGKRMKIHKAYCEEKDVSGIVPGTVISLEKDIIHTAAGDGVLCLTEVQPENHKKMSSADFIHGYQVKINDRFND